MGKPSSATLFSLRTSWCLRIFLWRCAVTNDPASFRELLGRGTVRASYASPAHQEVRAEESSGEENPGNTPNVLPICSWSVSNDRVGGGGVREKGREASPGEGRRRADSNGDRRLYRPAVGQGGCDSEVEEK